MTDKEREKQKEQLKKYLAMPNKLGLFKFRGLLKDYDKAEITMSKFVEEINLHFFESEQSHEAEVKSAYNKGIATVLDELFYSIKSL